MTLRSCPREKEVAALVARGHWPDAGGDELRAHVSGCRACGDQVLLMQAFQSARSSAMQDAAPVPAGVLWWRAQLRRRKSAMEQIGKPIVGAQIFALAITLLLAAVFAVWQARHGMAWLAWLRQLPESATFRLQGLLPSTLDMPSWALPAVLGGCAALALGSGLWIYFERQGREEEQR